MARSVFLQSMLFYVHHRLLGSQNVLPSISAEARSFFFLGLWYFSYLCLESVTPLLSESLFLRRCPLFRHASHLDIDGPRVACNSANETEAYLFLTPDPAAYATDLEVRSRNLFVFLPDIPYTVNKLDPIREIFKFFSGSL